MMPLGGFYLMAGLILASSGGLVGYQWAEKIGKINLMQCERAHLKAVNAASQEARERIARARQSADDAIVTAMTRVEQAETKTREMQYALKKHTTGRDCLSGPARGLLQSSPAFARQRVPEDSRGADSTAAAVAGNTRDRNGEHDGKASTDADLAEWAAAVSLRYEQCRARIDAVAEWDEKLNGRNRPSAGAH
jgi:hypothetical protein